MRSKFDRYEGSIHSSVVPSVATVEKLDT